MDCCSHFERGQGRQAPTNFRYPVNMIKRANETPEADS